MNNKKEIVEKYNRLSDMHKNKGITMIALVITIIVLLILASVSLSMLTGNSGIISNAQNASDATKKAEEKEAIKMAYAESLKSSDLLDIIDKETNTIKTDADSTSIQNDFKALVKNEGYEINNISISTDGSKIVVTTNTGNKYSIDEIGSVEDYE